MTETKENWWQRPVSIAPLITFRIVFGLLMFGSLLRFLLRGWVNTLFVVPTFHFTYWGFDWIRPMGPTGMYLLFTLILLSTLLITLGLFYRIAIVVFFIGFTYVEMIDVTTYLNHYYFISLVAFIMIWLPANRHYAIDVWLNRVDRKNIAPAWTIDLLKFQLAIVYIFAGLAKLNADWLLHAEPMKTWLPARSHLPVVGTLMYKEWVAYLFSWFGALYDCLIVFFLLYNRTRPFAYLIVLVFHIATAIFFPGIGLFPYVMIIATLIFFSGNFHTRILEHLPFYKKNTSLPAQDQYTFRHKKIWTFAIALYVIAQLLIPLRFLCYPQHLFWSEEGYRFSWRVMLMEKAGVAYFTIKDHDHSKSTTINNAAYLTPLQEKMMSTQPDMLLQFAHHLKKEYESKGWKSPQVYAEVYVALNGNRARLFIDTTVDLAAQQAGWRHYHWILPYK